MTTKAPDSNGPNSNPTIANKTSSQMNRSSDSELNMNSSGIDGESFIFPGEPG